MPKITLLIEFIVLTPTHSFRPLIMKRMSWQRITRSMEVRGVRVPVLIGGRIVRGE